MPVLYDFLWKIGFLSGLLAFKPTPKEYYQSVGFMTYGIEMPFKPSSLLSKEILRKISTLQSKMAGLRACNIPVEQLLFLRWEESYYQLASISHEWQ